MKMFNPQTQQIWQVEEIEKGLYRMEGKGVFTIAAPYPICPLTGGLLVELPEIGAELPEVESVTR